MKTCSKCAVENIVENQFCTNCGTRFRAVSPTNKTPKTAVADPCLDDLIAVLEKELESREMKGATMRAKKLKAQSPVSQRLLKPTKASAARSNAVKERAKRDIAKIVKRDAFRVSTVSPAKRPTSAQISAKRPSSVRPVRKTSLGSEASVPLNLDDLSTPSKPTRKAKRSPSSVADRSHEEQKAAALLKEKQKKPGLSMYAAALISRKFISPLHAKRKEREAREAEKESVASSSRRSVASQKQEKQQPPMQQEDLKSVASKRSVRSKKSVRSAARPGGLGMYGAAKIASKFLTPLRARRLAKQQQSEAEAELQKPGEEEAGELRVDEIVEVESVELQMGGGVEEMVVEAEEEEASMPSENVASEPPEEEGEEEVAEAVAPSPPDPPVIVRARVRAVYLSVSVDASSEEEGLHYHLYRSEVGGGALSLDKKQFLPSGRRIRGTAKKVPIVNDDSTVDTEILPARIYGYALVKEHRAGGSRAVSAPSKIAFLRSPIREETGDD